MLEAENNGQELADQTGYSSRSPAKLSCFLMWPLLSLSVLLILHGNGSFHIRSLLSLGTLLRPSPWVLFGSHVPHHTSNSSHSLHFDFGLANGRLLARRVFFSRLLHFA
ncbi:hypothetical protein GQ43DRAFT_247596 [Delitschia confertaspora ATCC 74209]|uniref:Uncharacterized protein n=1 Tax=Delitschia confertaspora ATCC 74209 TaxID=1513339 RepID=A0A9P4JBX6_9PLEO|nr:hypothetical protein GQ43DRAFT_247596 [Delitschia confertaspora ATCC 74209]